MNHHHERKRLLSFRNECMDLRRKGKPNKQKASNITIKWGKTVKRTQYGKPER
jgi:hypothetical protein